MHHTRTTVVAGASALVVLLTACSTETSSNSEAPVPEAPVPEETHWSYNGVDGPAEWAELDQQYETCGSGLHQSPVDLPSSAAPGGAAVTITAQPSSGTIEDTGHTVQLNDDGDASEVTVEGRYYELAQMHVHTPSEHTIDGRAADAEFHFVHESEDGDRLVVAVLGVLGQRSEAFAPFVVGSVEQADTATLDLREMLPASLDHLAYDGSLTTPPCTEGVEWIVMTTPVELSAEQLAALNVAHPGNTRPAQPLGDREVLRATATWDD